MIRFTCPSCKLLYTVTDQSAGIKCVCHCGQKLLIPPPPAPPPAPLQKRTVLGQLEDDEYCEPQPTPQPTAKANLARQSLLIAALTAASTIPLLLLTALLLPQVVALNKAQFDELFRVSIIGAVLVVVFTLWLTPVVIAFMRNHRNKVPILALNLLIGWTGLGWAAAFVWSLTSDERAK